MAKADLMARMGHDSQRAAMISQHQARGADQLIASAIDAPVQDEQRTDGEGPPGVLTRAGSWHANGPEDQQRLSGGQATSYQN